MTVVMLIAVLPAAAVLAVFLYRRATMPGRTRALPWIAAMMAALFVAGMIALGIENAREERDRIGMPAPSLAARTAL